MNRVILCGRLADRPRWATTPCGMPIVHLRLQVPRHGLGKEQDERLDEFDCLAFHELARRLIIWGERGLRLNVEGQLFTGVLRDEHGQPRSGCHVAVERADIIDPLPPPRVLRGTPAAEPPDAGTGEEKAA